MRVLLIFTLRNFRWEEIVDFAHSFRFAVEIQIRLIDISASTPSFSFCTDLRRTERPRVENAREELVDITAYENALIRRPHIIYISIVRC